MHGVAFVVTSRNVNGRQYYMVWRYVQCVHIMIRVPGIKCGSYYMVCQQCIRSLIFCTKAFAARQVSCFGSRLFE